LNKNGIILSNSVGDFSINDTLNSVLFTFNNIFENVYYFYDKSYVEQSTIKVANLYILATNNKDILNSEIFSKSMTTFRKIISLSIPSRILIN